MKIAVCLKQVPDSSVVSLDPETHTLVRSSVGAAINPLDEFPLEIALKIKDSVGAEITAITMGPPRAEEILARAIAMGADKGILLSDPAFAGSDTWATSYVLAQAVRKTGPYDLVLFGKQAIDGDTAQVGPETAAHLGWPQAAFVNHVHMPESANAEKLIVSRLFEDASEEIEIMLPAALTVLKEVGEPRFGSLAGRLKYYEDGITKITASDLELPPHSSGLKGSPTRVVRTSTPENNRKKVRIEGNVNEQAGKLSEIIRNRISTFK